MITAKLTDDMKWILVEGNPDEVRTIKEEFTKKIDSWFIVKSKCPDANIEDCFMNHLGFIPTGLWMELVNACRKFGFVLNFLDDFNTKIRNNNITRESLDLYINELFKKNVEMQPRDYQIEGVFNALCFRKSCIEVSTSGGKTLMAYMMFRFMIDFLRLRHILFITPKTVLTTQSLDKFVLYDRQNMIMSDWSYSEIHSEAKKKKEYPENIVFGNYQSLAKIKDKKFFEQFEAVIVDEAHHSSCTSIKKILRNCKNAEYKIGMTGTFPSSDDEKQAHSSFVIQSYIGPLVYRLSSHELINEKKSATPVVVNSFIIKYLEEDKLSALHSLRAVSKKDDPTMGNKLLSMEKEVVCDNDKRFRFITDIVKKTTHNCLIIFSDVENGYGRKFFDYLKEYSDKRCFYIDGNTDPKTRNRMKKAMEEDEEGKTVMVASMGCFSEGIDIANLWSIFLVETTKSENTLAQILGRGMRSYPGKDKTIVLDFVDDFRYGNSYYSDNYLYKHGLSRMDIYKKRGFPLSCIEMDLNK